MTFIQVQKSRTARFLAIFMVFNLLVEIISPLSVYAITSGPSQPEVQSFEPIGTNQMVDVFSGDFTYNIPLLDVGGYPVNISYHAGIGMEQDASWVGLGWNINPGVVNRNMRGIPDDFNGTEKIKKTTNYKPNWNLLLKTNIGTKYKEFLGFKDPFYTSDLGTSTKNNYNVGVYYNNYKGFGVDFNYNRAFKGITLNAGYNTSSGINLAPTYSIGKVESFSFGVGYNPSYGVQYISTSYRNEYEESPSNQSLNYTGHSFSGISYINPSYMPTPSPDTYSSSYDLNLKFGKVRKVGSFSARPIDAHLSVFGIPNDRKVKEQKAYGYFHLESAGSDGLMDFNRDNEVTPHKRLNYLPTAVLTHDIYSVSGQGTGGIFRPYRSRVGIVGDPNFNLISSNPNFGLGPEFGTEPAGDFHVGLDISKSLRFGSSEKWGGGIFDNYSYNNPSPSSVYGYEDWYFKSAGEKTVVDEGFYEKIGEKSALWVDLDKAKLKSSQQELGCNNCGAISSSPQAIALEKRAIRNQPIFQLTNAQAKFCLDKELLSSYTNANGQSVAANLLGAYRTSNHIREITSTNTDGSRYVYGLPAYNISQKEVVFAVGDESNKNRRSEYTICNNKGLVSYSSSGDKPDNSVDNNSGIDNFYSATETPAYAHSYLLTAVLSTDYVDVDDNGPTINDFGNYTKFNYYRAAENYKWRTPYTKDEDRATLMEGHKNDFTDDRGYYTYGEKEIWYMYTIETKTHIAEFILNDPLANPREDGNEAAGENGGVGENKLRYLEKIVLYTREDREKNGVNATPIKTIHFEYNYELCKGTPYNSSAYEESGKLTLKKIWFTQGNTTQGVLSPYEFNYSSHNPDYNRDATDRWGTYRKVNCSDNLNDDFPYTKQDKTDADENASAWNLTEIKLPSGGTMEVNYEADDYGYVQGKQAMEMMEVIGMGETSQFTNAKQNTLYDKGIQKKTNRYIFFKLPAGVTASNIEEKLEPDEHGVYFKFLVNLDNTADYEYVSGYASSEEIGVDNSKGYDVGFIKFKAVDVGKYNPIDAHPVSKAAWQKMRVELPHLIHPETDKFKSGSSDVGHIAMSIAGVFPRIATFAGLNNYMLTRLYGRIAKLNGYSVIRLKTPNKTKLGGGHRVKSILMKDGWDGMTTNESSQTTGQVYDYSKIDAINDEIISSGVATYEPRIGGDENPHKYPLYTYGDKRAFVVNDDLQFIGPVGESYYPGASVGYSQITVRNIKPTEVGLTESITRHGTGKSVFQFYTAYDFPVYSERHFDRHNLNTSDFASQLISLAGINIDYKAITQGFSIVTNDMHGKPKAKYDYGELDNETPISFIKYYYKVADDKQIHKSLDNKVTVLNKDGSIGENKEVGVEVELVFDTKKDEEYGGSLGIQPNFNLATVAPGPPPVILPIPTFFFSYNNFFIKQYRRVSATKLVNMYGVLDRVEVKEDGAVITTKNIAYDAETGAVLLTHTQNEYSDDIYNFTYPAHWAYDGMGSAYKNTGQLFSVNTTNGKATVAPELYNNLSEGDELGKNGIGTLYKAWVLKKIPGDKLLLIDKDGNPITDGQHDFIVLRSGRRNQQNAPIGSIVSTKNPINSITKTFANPSEFENNVINAAATEFSDEWQLYTDKISFTKGRGAYGDVVTSAVTYTGFMKNMIFQKKLLEDGEDIEDYVNAPATNLDNRKEREFLALKTGIISVPLISTDPDPVLTPLEWDVQASPPQNTLHSKITCTPGGGFTCNGNSCDFFIKLYEPTYGNGLTELDINNDLQDLTFKKEDNYFNATYKINSIYNVNSAAGGTLGSYYFNLLEEDGKLYRFEVTVTCFDQLTTPACILDYTGNTSRLVKDNIYNPFVWNVRGNWAPKKSLVYFDTRNAEFARKTTVLSASSSKHNETNMREDGKLENFIPYWYKQVGEENWTPNYEVSGYSPWTWNTELTIKNPNGLELESKDALGVYSSAIYGSNYTLPIAVASNTKLNQFCYDGFEESQDGSTEFDKYHFNFLYDVYKNVCSGGSCPPNVGTRAKITSFEAHSGNNSVEILKKESDDANYNLSLNNNFSVLTSITEVNWLWPGANATSNNNTDPDFSKLNENNVVKKFGPDEGDYIISYWVKEGESGSSGLELKYLASGASYNSMVTTFNLWAQVACDANQISAFNNNYDDYYLEDGNPYTTITPTTLGSSITINGWKRVQLKFTIPSNAAVFKMNFINNSTTSSIFIDDVRIFPYEGNMKSYAFDAETRRLMAELDENNYATFYEYDDLGNMIRIKRETDNGIVTINENRKNIKKQ